MELVLRNPFRILGLPVTASSREIAKRISDLELFAELGKSKSYPFDLSELGVIDRSLESIKDAARRIELPEMRLFHSLLWFRKGDAVDDLALECLSNFELNEADNLWGKQIDKSENLGKLSWRINRAVYCLWMSDDLDTGTAHFEKALEDIGYITDELYEEAVSGIPGAEQVSPLRVRELVVDALINHAANSEGQVYGPNAIQLIDHCWTFHADTVDYVKSRVTKPLINSLQDAIDRSKAKREHGTTIDDLRRKNGLSKVEHLIYELQASLGENNPTFQAVANSFANEVVMCSINAIREHEAVSAALVLAEWSAELPSYGQTREWLLEQRRRTLTWDPDYISNEDPGDDQTDSESDLTSDEDDEGDEIEHLNLPKKVPVTTTICPRCAKRFEPDEILDYTDYGVRCPYCNQSILI